VILLTVLLAASTPPPRLAPKPLPALNVCEIVTKDEVEKAFKRRFGSVMPDAFACEFSVLEHEVVAIKMQHSPAKIDVRAEMLTLRKAFPGARMRDASGFASPAFYLDFPGIGTQLFVVRGEHDFLLVTVLGLGDPKKVASGAKQIAKRALDRLPTIQ
jgi:hypothetical protein